MTTATPSEKPDTHARTLAGLLIAPVVGGAVAFMLFGIVDALAGNRSIANIVQLTGFGAMGGGLFGVIPSAIIGWPVHLLLLRQRWTSIWIYIGLGALIGLGAYTLSALAMVALL